MNLIRILAGDSRFFWPENIVYFRGIPQAWDASLNTGIGQPGIGTLWISGYLYILNTFTAFGVPWNLVLLIFWLFPALLLSFFSASYLYSFLFPSKKDFRFLAGMIYLINSYFIMNFMGGQTGVLLAYSIAPFILHRFIKLFEYSNIRNSLLAGVAISLQILFDPRFAYLSVLLLTLYWGYIGKWRNLELKKIWFWFVIPVVVIMLLHTYWMFPLLIFRSPSLPQNFDAVKGFVFFSFADFSHAFSLLHPNWPENVFGKTYFLEPWFLIVPMIAYSSLFFLRIRKNKSFEINKLLVFFGLLGLIGVFLAKGVNEPFGQINRWVYIHLPGMRMFRDPTKFYYFIIQAYALIIPWVVSEVYVRLGKKRNVNKNIWLMSFVLFWFILHLFSFLRYPHSYQPIKHIPTEYVALKDFIISSGKSYRTLWVPQWQRYGYFSPLHPAIGRGEIVGQGDPLSLARRLEKKSVQAELQMFGVKYIILPYDAEGELFLHDRHYDDKLYQRTKQLLDSSKWLNHVKSFGKIHVYEAVGDSRGRFVSSNSTVNWQYISSSRYQIRFTENKAGKKLIFSEAFDPHWAAIVDGKVVQSRPFKNKINSFEIPAGYKEIEVSYLPQQFVNLGFVVSGVTLLGVLFYLLRTNYQTKKK